MGADGLALSLEFHRGLGGLRRIDGEINGEMLTGENGAGNADGLGLKLRLCAARESDGIDGNSQLLGLPGGAGGGSVILIAVADQYDAMDGSGGKRGQRLADGRFEIGAASSWRPGCARGGIRSLAETGFAGCGRRGLR